MKMLVKCSVISAVPLALLLGACASSQSSAPAPAAPVVVQVAVAPPRLDPAGAYEFSTVVNGQATTGTMEMTGTPGAYTGKILTNMFPEIPIVSAVVEGDAINVKANMPDGELLIHMVFTGRDFKGNWMLGGQTGEFNGKKK